MNFLGSLLKTTFIKDWKLEGALVRSKGMTKN